MIGSILSIAIDGYAAIDRATDRRSLLIFAAQRCEAYAKAGQKRQLIVVRHPNEMRSGSTLSNMPDASAVVFIDCALELCNDEVDLMTCYTNVCRVAGSIDDGVRDIYVLRFQSWATSRTTLDPRVRWILTKAPPNGPLEYRPYGKRTSILADTRIGIREANQRKRDAKRDAKVAAKVASVPLRPPMMPSSNLLAALLKGT